MEEVQVVVSMACFQHSQLGLCKQLSASHHGKEKGLPLVNPSDCTDGWGKVGMAGKGQDW